MADRLHFLNTGPSDCIIIESDGRFAMVDAAEDSDFPPEKPHLNYKGYEEEVLAYLLENCRGENGRVTLDFVVGTHAHSDHIGGFDTVIAHPEVDVLRAYLKVYDESNIFIFERLRWDNREVYEQMSGALEEKNVPVISEFDEEKIRFGNFDITFFNGINRKRRFPFGENINSVVMLLEKGPTRLVLAGDLNYKDGDERRIAEKIGKVNLLKPGHHGYFGSTSFFWAKTLRPEICVVTNSGKRIYPDVRFKLRTVSGSRIYATQDENGVLVTVEDDGKLTVETDIMSGAK